MTTISRLAATTLIVGLLHLLACGDGTTAAGADDAGLEAGATKDAAREAGSLGDEDASRAAECRTLALTSESTITPQRITGTPPASTGGVLVDGVYNLTAVKMYTPAGEDSPPSFLMKATLEILGSSLTIVTDVSGPRATRTMAVRVEGSRMYVLSACDISRSGARSMVGRELGPIDFSSSAESFTMTDAFDKTDPPLPDEFPEVTVTQLTFTR